MNPQPEKSVTTSVPTTGKRWLRRGLVLLKFALLLLVLGLVGNALAVRLAALPDTGIAIAWGGLLAAWLLATAAVALAGPIYQCMLHAMGQQVPSAASYLVALLSPVGKYLPGKVGAIVGTIWIFNRFGVGAAHATLVTLLAAGATFAVSGLFLIPFLWLAPSAGTVGVWLGWVVAALVLLGLILAMLQLWLKLAYRLARRFRRNPTVLTLAWRPWLIGLAWTGVQIVLMSSAFWCVASAVSGVSWQSWYLIAASLVVSGLIGFFAFFAPAGIGVREGLLLVLLHDVLGPSELALAVIVLRLLQIVTDIVLAAGAGLFWFLRARR